jgi:hypothetical protein
VKQGELKASITWTTSCFWVRPCNASSTLSRTSSVTRRVSLTAVWNGIEVVRREKKSQGELVIFQKTKWENYLDLLHR